MPRRIFVSGEDASIRTLGKRETEKIFGAKFRPKLVRTTTRSGKVVIRKRLTPIIERTPHDPSKQPQAYSAAINIAHLFFPRNFPELIATGVPHKNTSSTTYTKQVPLTQRSAKSGISFYKAWNERDKWRLYAKHAEKFIAYSLEINRMLDHLNTEYGIYPNENPANFGFTNFRGEMGIVFFEVSKIHLPTLAGAIDAMPQKTKSQQIRKKQARGLLVTLMKQKKNIHNNFVQTHSV